MTGRLGPITRKEALHILRDPRSLTLAIGLPLLLLLLFGYAITFDIRHVGLAIVDRDGTSLSRDLAARLRAGDSFDLLAVTGEAATAEDLIDRGRAKIVLTVPDDFERDLAGGRPKPLQLLVDGSNNNTALVALGNLSRILQEFVTDAVREAAAARPETAAAAAGLPSFDVRTRVWYNPELRSTNFIVPGLIAVVMMVMTTMLTSLTVAREWEAGTMEQIAAAPVRPAEVVFGKLAPYVLLGFAQIALVVVVGRFVFRVPIRGDLVCLFVTSIVFLTCGMAFGLLLSILAKSQQLAYMFAVLTTILPSYMLSGFIFPISSMPKIIQLVTYLVPNRYFLTSLRGIFLKGYGFGQVWPEILGMTIYGAIVLAACVRRLRLRLD